MTRKSSNLTGRNNFNNLPTVNLGFKWFRINSPEDGVGLWLSSFSLAQTYLIDQVNTQRICQKLYSCVINRIEEGSLGDAKNRMLIYRQNTFEYDDKRAYIRITRDTVRGIRTTIFVRFLNYGNNIYVGLNTYVLGSLNWFSLFTKAFLTFVLLAPISLNTLLSSLFYFHIYKNPFMTTIAFLIIILMWWKLAWRSFYEKSIVLALRQEFPGKRIGSSGSFDADDIVLFSKSTLHLIVDSIREIFKEEDLPLDSLDDFIENISNITINNYGEFNNSGQITNKLG